MAPIPFNRPRACLDTADDIAATLGLRGIRIESMRRSGTNLIAFLTADAGGPVEDSEITGRFHHYDVVVAPDTSRGGRSYFVADEDQLLSNPVQSPCLFYAFSQAVDGEVDNWRQHKRGIIDKLADHRDGDWHPWAHDVPQQETVACVSRSTYLDHLRDDEAWGGAPQKEEARNFNKDKAFLLPGLRVRLRGHYMWHRHIDCYIQPLRN